MSDTFPHETEYTNLWANVELNHSRVELFQEAAKKIISHKDIYKDLEEKSGVPWYFIGLVHLRESDCDFKTHLHNGDSLRARTVHEPRGRPADGHAPFTFEFSALDALQDYKINGKWSIERAAYFLEKYNGFGYRQYHINSPYLWAGTNNYSQGKYIRDGVFSHTVVDTQLGAMGVLKCLLDLDEDTSKLAFYNEDMANISVKATPNTSPEYLLEGSRKYNIMDTVHNYLKVIMTSIAAFYAYVQSLTYEAAQDLLAQAKTAWTEFGPIGVLIVAFGLYMAISQLKAHTKDDITEGRYIPSNKES